jgi:hypothetical protein
MKACKFCANELNDFIAISQYTKPVEVSATAKFDKKKVKRINECDED